MSHFPTHCTKCGTALPMNAKFCVSCGTPVVQVGSVETLPPDRGDDPAPDSRPGVQLHPGDVVADKYVIDSLIGQGGMGMVFKATEKLTGQIVALKIIRQETVADDVRVKRLISEGMTTRDLAHPNIVRVYEIGLHGTQPFMAMEYIEGKPLHIWRSEKLARSEAVPVAVVQQIIKEILNGLEAAHNAGVVHRDLKPENVLLIGNPSGTSAQIKIVDFGIALGARMPSGATSGTAAGTQLYMAPEQIRNADLATPAADLFAVSKMFYELLLGVLPTGHWQPPSGNRSDVPRAFDDLIKMGLSASPTARPQTAAEYREKLMVGMAATENRSAYMEQVFDRIETQSWINIDRNDPKTRRNVMFCVIGFFVIVILAALDSIFNETTY